MAAGGENPLKIFLSELLEKNSRPTVFRSVSVQSDDCPSRVSTEEVAKEQQQKTNKKNKKKDAQRRLGEPSRIQKDNDSKQREDNSSRKQQRSNSNNSKSSLNTSTNSLIELMALGNSCEDPLAQSDSRWDSATSLSDESMPRSPARRKPSLILEEV